jgi:hypothetical protein
VVEEVVDLGGVTRGAGGVMIAIEAVLGVENVTTGIAAVSAVGAPARRLVSGIEATVADVEGLAVVDGLETYTSPGVAHRGVAEGSATAGVTAGVGGLVPDLVPDLSPLDLSPLDRPRQGRPRARQAVVGKGDPLPDHPAQHDDDLLGHDHAPDLGPR